MWNCADRTGSRVASGVYIVRLETPAGSQALKTVLER
jgi:hypothetical protein